MNGNKMPVVRGNGATGERKNETCDSSILRRCHRNAPRDRRRLALAEAMGAPPPWHRLGDVVREIA